MPWRQMALLSLADVFVPIDIADGHSVVIGVELAVEQVVHLPLRCKRLSIKAVEDCRQARMAHTKPPAVSEEAKIAVRRGGHDGVMHIDTGHETGGCDILSLAVLVFIDHKNVNAPAGAPA